MVETFSTEKNFTDERITQDTFLSSVKSWYPDDGVLLGVENVYPFETNYQNTPKKGFVVKCSILDDMEKCRARVIDQNGKAKKMEDQWGNLVDELETVDDADAVTLFIKGINMDEGNLKIGNLASAWEFINPVFVASGVLSENNKDGIIFTEEEFLECIEGYEFKCKWGKNPKSNRLHPVAENI